MFFLLVGYAHCTRLHTFTCTWLSVERVAIPFTALTTRTSIFLTFKPSIAWKKFPWYSFNVVLELVASFQDRQNISTNIRSFFTLDFRDKSVSLTYFHSASLIPGKIKNMFKEVFWERGWSFNFTHALSAHSLQSINLRFLIENVKNMCCLT